MNQIHQYSQIFKLIIQESYKDSIYTIQIGDLKIDYKNIDEHATHAQIKLLAKNAFILKYNDIMTQKIYNFRDGLEYIKYSKDTILKECTIHFNNEQFFETHKDITLIAFDSEGNKPLRLAQICTDTHNVYLFELPKYLDQIKNILQNPNIKKIICDVNSEQRAFDIVVKNAYDIQGSDRKSLVTCIHEVFDIKLKKSKNVHIKGWDGILSDKHINYAAADVLWMYKLYKIYEL